MYCKTLVRQWSHDINLGWHYLLWSLRQECLIIEYWFEVLQVVDDTAHFWSVLYHAVLHLVNEKSRCSAWINFISILFLHSLKFYPFYRLRTTKFSDLTSIQATFFDETLLGDWLPECPAILSWVFHVCSIQTILYFIEMIF